MGLGIVGDDDRGFVRNCRDWYERNEGRLLLNEMYGAGPFPEEEPLFHLIDANEPHGATGEDRNAEGDDGKGG